MMSGYLAHVQAHRAVTSGLAKLRSQEVTEGLVPSTTQSCKFGLGKICWGFYYSGCAPPLVMLKLVAIATAACFALALQSQRCSMTPRTTQAYSKALKGTLYRSLHWPCILAQEPLPWLLWQLPPWLAASLRARFVFSICAFLPSQLECAVEPLMP